ncbi:hypothetical protein GQ53DRAFT_751065 [Thozetella sp. PMI_491]|nr:hypothetical protein GQ53DRAFT_751065 [Thozetella sp. PMI_491]
MTRDADEIAAVVLAEFEKLPKKRKPVVRSNGLHEWVPLSGIVAKVPDGSFRCLSLATGMKCLPSAKLPQANGVALHDWHAEVLAMRAFNLFVLQECRRLASGELQSSEFLACTPVSKSDDELLGRPFSWNKGVSLHMYCSEAPCGDASMELTMAAQEDASPWEVPPDAIPDPSCPDGAEALPGRAYFSQLGIVRRKPARGDAPACLSKSCSDKIALKQCTSLLCSTAALLVSPEGVYLASLVLPESQHSAVGCARCFSAEGRMKPVAGRQWQGGYSFIPFDVRTTGTEFAFSKPAVGERSERLAASNMAVAWVWRGSGMGEALIGGILQGTKQFELKGASLTSRRRMWALATEAEELLVGNSSIPHHFPSAGAYRDLKVSAWLEARNRVKEEVRKQALQGWARNVGDDAFILKGGSLEHADQAIIR